MILLDTDILSLFHAGNETVVDRIAKVDADIDAKVAFIFDELCERKNLQKIGLADLLIASITLANDALLVTRNLRHFRHVPYLKLENWED